MDLSNEGGEQAELRNIVRLSTFYGNSGRTVRYLRRFTCDKRDRKVANNSSATRTRRRFWILSRLGSDDWAAPLSVLSGSCKAKDSKRRQLLTGVVQGNNDCSGDVRDHSRKVLIAATILYLGIYFSFVSDWLPVCLCEAER